MKKKLACLVLAALVCAGAASAEGTVTITYGSTSVAVGEDIEAYYRIEGIDCRDAGLYWAVALTDEDYVRKDFPNQRYDGVVYWMGDAGEFISAAEGGIALSTVGSGFAKLAAGNPNVEAVYPQGDIVDITGEYYTPAKGYAISDRTTAAPGDMITVSYAVEDDRERASVWCEWDWVLVGGDTLTCKESQLGSAASGTTSLIVFENAPSNAKGVNCVIGFSYADGFDFHVSAYTEITRPSVVDEETEAVNGLRLDGDGVFRYYRNGDPDTTYFGLVEYGGGRFLVAHGEIVQQSGLQLIGEDWYFLSNGQVADHTGLALYDGEWFYVANGVLDTARAGIVTYDGREFMLAAGRILTEASGMIQDPVTGAWYYVANGQVTDFTGLVEYAGSWFWVDSGRLAAGMTGAYEYNGAVIRLENGQLVG